MKRIAYCLYFLILLTDSISAFGQLSRKHPPEARLFSIENGLSQTRVTVNFLDSEGYLWVGSSDGLNRFNGYDFDVFRHKPLDSLSISNNYIRCISEDPKGRLWIGTNMGLNVYDPSTGDFRSELSFINDTLNLNLEIEAMLYEDPGKFWIVTNGILISIHYDSILGKEPHLNSLSYVNRSLRGTNCMIMDRKGLIWIGSDNGLIIIDVDEKNYVEHRQEEDNSTTLSDNRINSIFEDRNGEIWIGTGKGINKYNRIDDKFTRYDTEKGNSGIFEINSITDDLEGQLWFGGENGISYFNKRTMKLENIPNLKFEKGLGKLVDLSTLICDNSNILWAGGTQGLVKMDLKPKKFELYNDTKGSFPQLSQRNVSAVSKLSNNFLWVGYREKGLDRIDLRTGQVSHYTTVNSLKDNNVRCIFPDSKGRVWVGTRKGISIYSEEKNEFIDFESLFQTIPDKILVDRQILEISEDSAGVFWFGTDEGLYAYNEKIKTIRSFQKIYNPSGSIKLGRVYSISIDGENNLWLGTEKGLVMYNPYFDIFERIKQNNQYKWLNKSPVYSVMAGSGNNLWIGTSYGLSVYNVKENTFSHFAEKDGIANSFVYEIQEDIESNIWVSTNKGLSKFDPLSGSFRNFSRNEGLQANEFNWGASFATADGELLFGGVSGLNSFYPDEMPENPVVPSVSITNFEIIDASGIKSIPVGKNTSFVKVRYNQSFKVDFSALDFSYPISNRYMYSLEELGRPEKWIRLGEERSVTISNLTSGEYILSVKGSNNDGIWNPRGVNLRILVEAPFWKTRIALITFILLIVISFYFIIQYRTQSLRQTNRILKERDLAGQEVSRQKELISKRNKNIEDSLKYAHRIQSAMLTTPEQFKAHLPNSFILHKPKDIVSGDFFWLSEVDDSIFVAAVDCTGHGVPGAFMSVIGFELFRKIINMQGIRDPGKILNHLNQNFQDIFSSGNDISLRDGMDLAFCVLDKKKMMLKFAGAFSPLYLIRDNKLIEIKGDRFSVGADNDPSDGFSKKSFTSHELKLEKEDMIYLFSDGYADQFGGPEGKKYKYRRFRHLLLTIHQLPLHRQKIFLDESIEEWRGNYEQIDDILVIGIQPRF